MDIPAKRSKRDDLIKNKNNHHVGVHKTPKSIGLLRYMSITGHLTKSYRTLKYHTKKINYSA